MANGDTESAARLHGGVLDVLECGAILCDGDGRVRLWNAWLAAASQIPAPEALGQPLESLFPDIGGGRIARAVEDALKRGFSSIVSSKLNRSPLPLTVRVSGQEPKPMSQTIIVKPVEAEDEARLCLLQIFDVTSADDRERILRAQAANLKRSNGELQEFAYAASHDLQEPLRKVRVFTDRVLDKYGARLDEAGRDYLMRANGAAARMQTLIADLLALSRVSTQGQSFVAVDLGAVAREVVSDLEIAIQDAKAEIDIGTLPTIGADPMQMRQLLQNLIGNAIKYRSDDRAPVIRVRSRALEGKARPPEFQHPGGKLCEISVSDNGIGIAAADSERIFGVFHRLHGRGQYEGTGIGLAICRRIVDRHAGAIRAESGSDDGTVFTVLLPWREVKSAPAAASAASNRRPNRPTDRNISSRRREAVG